MHNAASRGPRMLQAEPLFGSMLPAPRVALPVLCIPDCLLPLTQSTLNVTNECLGRRRRHSATCVKVLPVPANFYSVRTPYQPGPRRSLITPDAAMGLIRPFVVSTVIPAPVTEESNVSQVADADSEGKCSRLVSVSVMWLCDVLPVCNSERSHSSLTGRSNR